MGKHIYYIPCLFKLHKLGQNFLHYQTQSNTKMPLKLDVRKKLSARSDRVKSVDLHPSEPWMLASLYNGNVHIWNVENQQIVKTFEVCDLPVRVAKFVARQHWVITGSDDMKIRIFNYNTLDRVHQFEAHADYIRSIAIHPTSSFILTASDDMSIKLWNWDKKWICTQVFEGHSHYVMQVTFNPKDNNSFSSASLDKTVKVWQMGSSTPNFTLEGHEKGVNCVSYYNGGDKPYLISGADDRVVKIWDYQNKACVQTLQGHAHNISSAVFHPTLPIIITGSEDNTFKIWHSSTYRLETTLNYGMDRAWCIACQSGSNQVALGFDEGSVLISLGREAPAMSMDASGKILWAKHSEIQQANLKSVLTEDLKDGEALTVDFKDLGSSDLYPQNLRHNANGRFVVVCGDGEYVIYTAMALRNKCFGAAEAFAWSADGNDFAIKESSNQLKIFKNFKEKTKLNSESGAEDVFGGNLLGVKSSSGLIFYDWDSGKIIRRIEITAKNVMWNESGSLLSIITDDSFFILKYDAEAVAKGSNVDEDGIEDAFEVVGEVAEIAKTGVWVGDCFIYTNSFNRLNYFVGGEIVTISHLDKVYYVLGYLPKENRIFLGDKEMNVVSFSLLLSIMEYQTCVMRGDFDAADEILPTIPKEQRNRVAHFLEKQGFKAQALAVTTDEEHKFDLALHLGDLVTAHQVAKNPSVSTSQKWKQLAEIATKQCNFQLAQECLDQAEDYAGLLLMATSSGNSKMVERLAKTSSEAGQNNIAFLAAFIRGNLENCLQILINSNRLAEASFFARTYLPSRMSEVVNLWKCYVAKTNTKAASAIADPTDYENLFPGLRESYQAESLLRKEHSYDVPALAFASTIPNHKRDLAAEIALALSSGADLDSAFDKNENRCDINDLCDEQVMTNNDTKEMLYGTDFVDTAAAEDNTPIIEAPNPSVDPTHSLGNPPVSKEKLVHLCTNLAANKDLSDAPVKDASLVIGDQLKVPTPSINAPLIPSDKAPVSQKDLFALCQSLSDVTVEGERRGFEMNDGTKPDVTNLLTEEESDLTQNILVLPTVSHPTISSDPCENMLDSIDEIPKKIQKALWLIPQVFHLKLLM